MYDICDHRNDTIYNNVETTDMWRDWFTFTRQDRRAIIMLSIAIAAVWIVLYLRPQKADHTLLSEATDSIATTLTPTKSETAIVQIDRHRFNPNEADSLELLTLGLPPRVASNILRYRRAGGQFRRAGDVARIYGMHDTLFAQLEPYISIPPEPKKLKPTRTEAKMPQRDTIERIPPTRAKEHPYAEYMRAKHKPGTVVDLNTADTTELMRIPGIGPVYAKMIVDYRRQLGGYHNITQLREIEGLPEELGDWVHISTPSTEKLAINKLSVTRLRSHPYLTFYQAKAIVDLRHREGDIKSVRQLLFLDEFSETDIERLKPYLSFE